jgi:hypothetical protein
MSLRVLNPNAEVLNKSASLHMNINATKVLQDVLKTNLSVPKELSKYMQSSNSFSRVFFFRLVAWLSLLKMETLSSKKWFVFVTFLSLLNLFLYKL